MMNMFQVATNDQSLYYLGRIFGNVGSVLAGTGPDLLGKMFKVFNTGVLAVGAIIVVHTTIMGVLGTAHEGEFLGRKMHSMWVPIRTVAGIAGLMPTSSGYCAIQMVMMWIIIQGIGVADAIWSQVIDYFQAGGAISMPANLQAGGTYQDMQTLFNDLVCQAAIEKWHCLGGNCRSKFSWTASACPGDTSHQCYIYPMGPGGMCDTLTIRNYSIDPFTGDVGSIDAVYQAQKDTLTFVVPTLKTIAEYTVDQLDLYANYVNDPHVPKIAPKPSWYMAGDKLLPSDPSDAGEYLWTYVVYPYTGTNFIRDAVNAYIGAVNNVQTKSAPGVAPGKAIGNPLAGLSSALFGVDLKKTLDNARANGWIFAGGYYYFISSMTNSVVRSAIGSRDVSLATGSKDKNTDIYVKTGKRNVYTMSKAMVDEAKSEQNAGGGEGKFGGAATVSTGNAVSDAFSRIFSADLASGITALFMSMVSNQAASDDLGNTGLTPTNPIVNLQAFGEAILIIVQIVFFALIIVAFSASAVASVASSVNPLGFALTTALNYLLPAVMACLFAMFTFGATLAVYVPLIPYIIFTFGGIGWMIATIETMVAAPIVALGVMHPEGQHELWGKSEQSVMIILNIFLRPSLMIFGMFGGMLMSYVVVMFINAAFLGVMNQIYSGPGLVETFLFMASYTGLVITSLNKCFSLIHIVPDKVLRWIGGGIEQFGEAEGLKEMEGRFSGSAGALQSSMKSASDTGVKKLQEGAKGSGTSVGGSSSSGGSSGGGAGGGGAGGGSAGGGGGGGAGGGGAGGGGAGGGGAPNPVAAAISAAPPPAVSGGGGGSSAASGASSAASGAGSSAASGGSSSAGGGGGGGTISPSNNSGGSSSNPSAPPLPPKRRPKSPT